MSSSGRGLRLAVAVLILIVALLFLSARIGISYSSSLLESRQHQQARGWLDSVACFWPKSARWHYLSARTHRRMREFDQFEADLRIAQKKGWDREAIQWERLVAQAQQGRFRELTGRWDEMFQRAGSDGPEIGQAFVTQALGTFQMADAARGLQAWKRDFPDDPTAYLFAGQIEEAYLNWAQAEEEYRTGLEYNPGHPELSLGLARCLIRLRELNEAIELLEEIHTDAPASEYYELLAQACFDQGDFDRAEELCARGLSKYPSSLMLRKLRVSLLLEKSELDQSLVLLSVLAAEFPADVEIRYQLGRTLQRLGRKEEAQPHLEFAEAGSEQMGRLNHLHDELTKDPDNPDLLFEVAMIYYNYKSRQEGIVWLKNLLQRFPHYQPALEVLHGQ
ncbi:MAG: tetratricopeptide repeat protein [Planctomycetaceae bacterium]|nr:tetratricopeptide repeat protein [Planctomycetaceae bacterium]